MIVAIVGSRRFSDLMRVERFVCALARKYPDATIKSGGAPGVDIESEQAGHDCGLRVISYRPVKRARHYEVLRIETRHRPVFEERRALIRDATTGEPYRFPSYGAACFSRNTWIVARGPRFDDESDQVVAFWDGMSNGTKDSIDKATASEKPLTIYRPEPQPQAAENDA